MSGSCLGGLSSRRWGGPSVPVRLPVLCPRSRCSVPSRRGRTSRRQPQEPLPQLHTPAVPAGPPDARYPGARGWRTAACDSVTVSMAAACDSASTGCLVAVVPVAGSPLRAGVVPEGGLRPDRGREGPSTCPSAARGHGSIPACPAPVPQTDAPPPRRYRAQRPPSEQSHGAQEPHIPFPPLQATPAPMGARTVWGLVAGRGGGREGW